MKAVTLHQELVNVFLLGRELEKLGRGATERSKKCLFCRATRAEHLPAAVVITDHIPGCSIIMEILGYFSEDRGTAEIKKGFF